MNKQIDYRDKWIQVIGIPVITLFEYYLTYVVYKKGWLLLYELTSDAFKIFIIWQLFRQIIFLLDRKLPYQSGIVKRLIIQIVITEIVSVAVLTLLVHLEYYFLRPYENQHFFSWDLVIAFLFILQVNVIYIGLYFYQSYLEKQKIPDPVIIQADQIHPVVTYILVRTGNRNIKVDYQDILAMYSENKDSFIITRENKTYIMDLSLDKFEEQMNGIFFRANRQFIITRTVVSELKPDVNGKISVKLNPHPKLPETITVSRTKAPSFRSWMECQ